ncbi:MULTISPECIES: winged helix-turn-helix domain-containing protein [Mangrovimonas]|uniref:winged helix-turn-helix domain-containing protein n=1 Tax=Mangrovimonas TaxID=1211036 RepID=UPI0006B68673|nr:MULTISPECIES: LysR family transcriptional regulator [Mangrovimonas]OMP30548.1 molybdenum transporter [Mangrovimonas sp. DI 80]
MNIKSRVWIENDGKTFLGFGRILLLKKVEETSSINAAAKAMNMSYKKAWKLMNDMNDVSKEPILIKNIGGKNGGGTTLTPYGKALIEQFETINNNCMAYLESEFKKLEL